MEGSAESRKSCSGSGYNESGLPIECDEKIQIMQNLWGRLCD